MHFELAAKNILAWMRRIVSGSPGRSEVPRGLLIVVLALCCWLAIALLVWGAFVGVGG